MRSKLFIFPFNGNGLEALDCIDDEKYEVVGFVDDDCNKKSIDYPIFSREVFSKYKEAFVLAVPGSPVSYQLRSAIIKSLELSEDRFISAIHPSASLGRKVQVGYNCLIMAGVVLTSNASIGNHVCILPNSVVHHDSVVKEYCLIGSNVVIAGGTSVGRSCYIGSGSNIINGISIGANTLVGLGSNILHSVENDSKMVGNPARNLNMQLV